MSYMLAYIESEGPPGDGADVTQDMNEGGYEEGGVGGAGSPAPLKSELISLLTEGGGFKACDYVGPEIAAFCNADLDVMVEPWLAEFLTGGDQVRRADRPAGVRGDHQAAALSKDGGVDSGPRGASARHVCGLERDRQNSAIDHRQAASERILHEPAFRIHKRRRSVAVASEVGASFASGEM